MIAILGAGISGISAGYHLGLKGIDFTVFEKNERCGGLCDNFTIGNGFRFDYFVHLSFTKSEYVKELFAKSSDYIIHKPISSNYYKGYWLKHPAQNNLAPLLSDEKVKIITDFINKSIGSNPQNYKEWLRYQFGNYFSQNFPETYTEKYWTVKAEQLVFVADNSKAISALGWTPITTPQEGILNTTKWKKHFSNDDNKKNHLFFK